VHDHSFRRRNDTLRFPIRQLPFARCCGLRYRSGLMNDPITIRRLYGRRQGHKLREGQAALVEDLLPRVGVPEGLLDSTRLFGDARPLEVEIGFGAGEHLAGQATARPGTGFIGCEPFLNGVVGALNHIRDERWR
jgi:tRNA (guanine-N7-)-methyltransferase